MIFLPSSVKNDFLVTRDDLVISVDFVKVMHSRHSHQLPPRFCGRLWRVMRTIEDEKFSWAVYDAWGSAPNLMCSGGATRKVATWRVLIEGVDGMTLGFPAIFQFPWIFGFKTFLFLYFNFCSEYYLSRLFLRSLRLCSGDSDPALATLLSEFFWLRPFCSSRYVTLLFPFCSLSLIIFLWVPNFSFALCFCCFCVWFLGF